MNKFLTAGLLLLSVFLSAGAVFAASGQYSVPNLPNLQSMLSQLPPTGAGGLTKSQILSRYNNSKSSKNAISKKIKKSVLPNKVRKPAVLPPSEIEKMYYRLYPFGKPLKQFGYNFFRGRKIKTTLVGAVGNNYIAGPGDSLSVYLTGAPSEVLGIPNAIKNLKVNREGMINLPYIGAIYVWGKSLGEIKNIISRKFSKRFKNVSVSVSVNKLRQFTVYVSGFVKKPGPVLVNGTYSVLDALTLAGGVSREGSLRNVIIRENINGVRKVLHIDLYNLLLKGLPVNSYLYQGDVIYVPPVGQTAAVEGAVKRPSIYEIKPGTTVKQVISMAGGLQFFSHKENVKIINLSNGKFRALTSNLSNRSFIDKKVLNGQIIVVGSTFSGISNEIKVTGRVAYPGIYSTKTAPDLKSLIKKVGLLRNTNLNYAQIVIKYENKIIKFSPREVLTGKFNVKLKSGDEITFYSNWINKPIGVSGYGISGPSFVEYYKGMKLLDVFKNIHFKVSPRDLKAYIFSNVIKKKKSNLVRVVFLNDLLYHNNIKDNIKLLPGESILIKKLGPTDKTSTVTILGQVRYPGAYKLKKGMTLYDLIIEAGGYTSDAYPKALVFIRRSIKALQKIQLKESMLEIQSSMAKTSPVTGVGTSSQQGLLYQSVMHREKQYLSSLKAVSMQGLGRISLDIPNHLRFLKYSNQNIKLTAGDSIYVPSKPDYVLVMGAVFNQIAIPYVPGKNIGWYLRQAGGLKSDANAGQTYLIKANGRVVSAAQLSSFWSFIGIGKSFYNQPVAPGSSIVVPPKFEAPILWMPLIKDITQIMFQSISTVALVRYL